MKKNNFDFTTNPMLDYLFWNMTDIKINHKTKSFDLYISNIDVNNRLIGWISTKQSGNTWIFDNLEINGDLDTLFCLDEMFCFLKQLIIKRGLWVEMTTIYNSLLGVKSGDLAGFSS